MVSHDLQNWGWSESGDGESFTYTFSAEEDVVYFAHHMLYHPQRFMDFAAKRNMDVKTLCDSEKGRPVPAIKFGGGEKHILLTARHHACESSGSYVLEGVLDALIENPIPGYTVFCVPFVDFDGVVEGDQGKNRIPYEYNRDYDASKRPIYSSTAAIRKFAEENHVVLGFDFHSPWHTGGRADRVFIPQKSFEKADRFDKFGMMFEKNSSKNALEYLHKFDMKANEDWNTVPSATFAYYLMTLETVDIALTLETTYFGIDNTKFSEKKALQTGRDFAATLREFIKKAPAAKAD